jgi:NAD(P)-dependent dehydrogenase (short-subunit alcohol dehydrogenase family)
MPELNPEPDHGETSYEGRGLLEGRVALITEADSGIGRAVAIAFAREGADLMLSSRVEPTQMEITAGWVRQAGHRAINSHGDVRQESYRRDLVDRTLYALGGLDIVVTNSAFQWAHDSLQSTAATAMEDELRTYNESVFFLSEVAASSMGPGGSIIHTTAMRSSFPAGDLRAYATTRTAVENFTASFAQRLAGRDIRVNAVAPGPVWTHRIVAMLPASALERFGRDTLRGRPAQPAELAPVYVFLASKAAKAVSGAVIPVGTL